MISKKPQVVFYDIYTFRSHVLGISIQMPDCKRLFFNILTGYNFRNRPYEFSFLF